MWKIAITPHYFYPGEAEAIASVLRGGELRRVHIRKPGCGHAAELRSLLEAIPKELRGRITLHDGHQWAAELGYGGVHLSARCPQPPAGWSGIVSRAVHDPSELTLPGADYQLLSPVFPSISKPGHNPPWSLESIAEAIRQSPVPVIALGGVTRRRLPEVERAGFAGAAMHSDAWRREIPAGAFALQFITHGADVDATVAGAAEALRGGCRWVQLRMKEASRGELLEAGNRIAGMCREHGAVFIVDDYPDLCMVLGADGVHLGKNDMPLEEARCIVGPGKIVGATANTLDDLQAAQLSGADYVGLGPFRFTTTKKRLSPILGTEGYRRILSGYHSIELGAYLPVVAIGGITIEDIPAVMGTGVQGIALSGAILNAPDPAAMTARIRLKIHSPEV